MLDNLDLDMLCEALMIMVRDRYSMPNSFQEFGAKYERIRLLMLKLQEMRPSQARELS